MRNKIQERICDECGKKVQMTLNSNYGEYLFGGWMMVIIDGGVTGERPAAVTHLDFCSAACAGKHLTLWDQVEQEKIKT